MLSVKFGIAALLAGVVLGAVWVVRDYLAVRQNARSGQQAAIYLVNQQQEQAAVNQQRQAQGQSNVTEGQDQARDQGQVETSDSGDRVSPSAR